MNYKQLKCPRTVEVHRARLMEKLGVHSISELVRLSMSSTASDQPAGSPPSPAPVTRV